MTHECDAIGVRTPRAVKPAKSSRCVRAEALKTTTTQNGIVPNTAYAQNIKDQLLERKGNNNHKSTNSFGFD